MERFLKWYRGRRWEYLGYTELKITYKASQTGQKSQRNEIGSIHFFAWENDKKKRKYEYRGPSFPNLVDDAWFNRKMMPWLNGADMWKPIEHPIATKGTLINYVGNQPKV